MADGIGIQLTEKAQLLARLASVVGSRRLLNDTSLADATADAIDVARTSAGFAPGSLEQITNDELLQYARNVSYALRETVERSLPFRAKLVGLAHGVVDVVGRAYALKWREPGLRLYSEAWRDNHAANLERLLSHLADLMEHQPYSEMGPPSVVAAAAGHVAGRALPRLVFRPIRDAAGLVITLPLDCDGLQPFPTTPIHQLDRLARVLDCEIRAAWNRRLELGGMAFARGREIVSTVEAFSAGTGMAVGRLRVAASNLAADARPMMAVELTALNDALRTTRRFEWAPLDKHAGRFAHDAAMRHRALFKKQTSFCALDADGEIDAVAAELIRLAPGGIAGAIAHLASEPCLHFILPANGGAFAASVAWHDGIIKGTLTRHPDVDLNERRLRITGHELPASVQIAAAGRTLGEVALPFPCDLVISRCTSRSGSTTLELARRRLLVDLSTGRMWQASKRSASRLASSAA